jgi:hypothetical protein
MEIPKIPIRRPPLHWVVGHPLQDLLDGSFWKKRHVGKGGARDAWLEARPPSLRTGSSVRQCVAVDSTVTASVT